VLNWFESYLVGRRQQVRIGSTFSSPSIMFCGVPQGSVLGPMLFLLYTAELLQLIQSHGLHPHLYADDTQIYDFCAPNESESLQIRLSVCIDHVAEWMRSNRLLTVERGEDRGSLVNNQSSSTSVAAVIASCWCRSRCTHRCRPEPRHIHRC
jgi:hypothetical protein